MLTPYILFCHVFLSFQTLALCLPLERIRWDNWALGTRQTLSRALLRYKQGLLWFENM